MDDLYVGPESYIFTLQRHVMCVCVCVSQRKAERTSRILLELLR